MKKKIIIIIIILVAIVLSQPLAISLVRAHKIDGAPAKWIAETYRLKAATIQDGDLKIEIPLVDYLEVRTFIDDFKDEGMVDFNEQDELAWDRLLRDVWLNKLATEKDLHVSPEELEGYISFYIPDLEEFKQGTEEDFGVSFEDYKKFVIEPTALELKIYNYLLANYNDLEGISKAQGAYEALDKGQDFNEVGKVFSDDLTLVDGSVYLKEDQLVDFYEPIKDLEVGGFSKILQIPMPPGYIIWYLAADLEQEDEMVKEVKAIFIDALPMDEFFKAYLNTIEIEKHY